MGLARTPPPHKQLEDRSSSLAPVPQGSSAARHLLDPARLGVGNHLNSRTGPASTAGTSPLIRSQVSRADEAALFANIASSPPSAASSKPLSVQASSVPKAWTTQRDSASQSQSQFKDAAESQLAEYSQNSRFGDAAELSGATGVADIFTKRPKLARSPPGPLPLPSGFSPDLTLDTLHAHEVKREDSVAPQPAFVVCSQGDTTAGASPAAVHAPSASEACPQPGNQVLARALLGRGTSHNAGRHSFPLAAPRSRLHRPGGSPSGTNSTTTAHQWDHDIPEVHPLSDAVLDLRPSVSSAMPRSVSLGGLTSLQAIKAAPRLELSDAISSLVRLKRQLQTVSSEKERQSQRLGELERTVNALTQELYTACAQRDEARNDAVVRPEAAEEKDTGVWKMSVDEYSSMISSLSSIPGLQSTIMRLRFRDRRRLVETSHQRWQRKWLVQLGEGEGGVGSSCSEAVRRERIGLVKAQWREEDLKGRMVEVEHERNLEKIEKERSQKQEAILSDQLNALQEQLATEREAWLVKEVQWEQERASANSKGGEAETHLEALRQDLAKCEAEAKRLQRETDKRQKADDVMSKKLKGAEEARDEALASVEELRAELETANDLVSELKAQLRNNAGKSDGTAQLKKDVLKWEKRGERWSEEKQKLQTEVARLKGTSNSAKNAGAVVQRMRSLEHTVVQDSQPLPLSEKTAQAAPRQRATARSAAAAARAALVEADVDDQNPGRTSSPQRSDEDETMERQRHIKTSTPVAKKAAIRRKRPQAQEEEYAPKASRSDQPRKDDGVMSIADLQKQEGKRKLVDESDAAPAPQKGKEGKKKRRVFGAKEKGTFDWGGNDNNMLGIPPQLSPVKAAEFSIGGVGSVKVNSIFGGSLQR